MSPPTTRQLDALRACLTADCNKAAAANLGMSHTAFRSLLHRLYRGLGVARKAAAVAALDERTPGWRAAAA
jgi:hypothetical protein